MEFSYSIPIPSPDVSRPVPRLPGQLPSISPAGASTAQKASQQRQQLLIAGLGALASLLTVVATSVSITGMYSTVHRQRSLVRKLHGWSGLYMFRQVVAWETGLWGTLAIVIAWRSVTSWQAGRTESIAEGRRPHDLLSWAYTAPWAWAGTAGVGIATLSILSYAGSIEH
ncbi:putative permease [Cutibacterium acnes KPA171202]|uniref:Permease n=1 Tax=Cutibacterium acnes (strain DSM 16379 / KPA171202) TaxID=267747 RepID=Q6A9L1_CUTAK|nr:putative permease [Cutibacterium acnes KPA171202]